MPGRSINNHAEEYLLWILPIMIKLDIYIKIWLSFFVIRKIVGFLVFPQWDYNLYYRNNETILARNKSHESRSGMPAENY